MTDEAFGALLLGHLALFVLMLSGHVLWVLGGAVVLGVLAGVAVLVPLLLAGAGRTSVRTVHIDAGTWADAARHEGGHLAAMKRYGGRNLRARIYRDGSGWARADLPPLTPDEELAIDYAGGYAEGSWRACGSDLAQARRVLAGVGWWSRDAMETKGRSRARRAVAGGATHHFRARLERTGRYR